MTSPIPSARSPKTQGYHHGELRHALLDAGEIELEENGIERFSLRAVAKRAGVSHGAPAHHFETVQGLLTALAARGYGRFIAAQDKREQLAGADPRERLAASGLGYIDFAIEHPSLFRLMFASERTDKADTALAEAAAAAFDKLVKHVQTVRDCDPHTDPPAMADVLACWAIAHGLADLVIADRLGRAEVFNSMSAVERDAFFADIILRGIPVRRKSEP
ncbi:MAG: TetR/AcrR family transcriptional regulator [Aquisalinus sp.]|nr:TetR/AcrR family transcriptional regulator [Aquisalinus sp.]